MSLGIVPGQSTVQINANPVMLSDKDWLGAGIQSDPSARFAVLVGCLHDLQWAHEYTLNCGHLKSITMWRWSPKRL